MSENLKGVQSNSLLTWPLRRISEGPHLKFWTLEGLKYNDWLTWPARRIYEGPHDNCWTFEGINIIPDWPDLFEEYLNDLI